MSFFIIKRQNILRKNFKPQNGMVIKLEPLTKEYSRNRHAHFTNAVFLSYDLPNNGIIEKAIRPEISLHNKLLRGK